jgi:hypothetical protein
MRDYSELERLAEAFPEYDWDSNTEPFFNGLSGESLGGGSTGFYCVYGPDFEIDGELYDGNTLVEICRADEAKFICQAKAGILALIAENKALKAKTETYCTYGDEGGEHTYYGDKAAIEALTALVFEVEGLRKDSGRYRWLRDKSESVHQFFLGVRFRAQDVDKAIDAMSKGEQS